MNPYSSPKSNPAPSSGRELVPLASPAGPGRPLPPPPAARMPPAAIPDGRVDWPDDEVELLHFGDNPCDGNSWCLQDAYEGVQIFGGTGSGKSSGSGRALARAFIESRMGGLVLTAKRDEVGVWRRYMKRAAERGIRPMSDLVVFSPESGYKFNFMRYAYRQYESGRGDGGAGRTENLVNLFCSVLEVAEKKSSGGGTSDSYWQRTLRQLLRNAIDLSILALDDVDLETLHVIISTAPATPETGRLLDPHERLRASICLHLIDQAAARPLNTGQRHDLELTRTFWEKEFPALAEETRSIIVSTFTSMADCFLRGTLYDLFCTELSAEILPERCWDRRKIIVVELPVKEFHDLGQFGQVLYKYLWQRAVERRVPVQDDASGAPASAPVRPVFLWADEAQFFANSYDAQFQSTARSSRACTVYLTQNLPSYQSVMGGAEAKAQADMFLGNLVTKIFHSNGDATTNTWGSEMIGKGKRFLRQATALGMPGAVSDLTKGMNMTEHIGYAVEPQEFTVLRRGGRRDGVVDAIIFQNGREWVSGERRQNFIRHSFQQND